MINNISKILMLAETLNHEDLLEVNYAIVELIKARSDYQNSTQKLKFSKGDIVSFEYENKQRIGVVIKKHQKSIKVVTTDNYTINVPAMFLRLVKNPSEEVVKLKENLFLSPEEINNLLQKAILGSK